MHDIGHDNTYWWATMSTDPDLAAHWPYGKADLLRRFRAWAPEISEIIAATTESDILALPAQDRPPLSRWGRGRVTLLGDAAHPMLPSLGQGANSAIEDAVVLAHALATHSDPETALRAYERQRLPRTTALVDGSRALGRVEQTTNLAVTSTRNRIVRHMSEKQLLAGMTKPMIWPGFGDEQRFGPAPRPLSSLERWHWTADQAAPLHIASSVRISGRVDTDTFRAALDALVHRHPILRTAIRSDGGRNPRFVPAQLKPIPLRLVDGGSWLTEIDGELRDGFHPDAPLLRATLIAVEPGVHDFMLTSTYSIADAVSVVSLARQVLEMAADGVPDWTPEFAAPSGPEHLVPDTFQGLRGKGHGLARLAADAIRDRRTSPVRLSPDAQVPPEERFTRLAHRTIGGSEYRALRSECRRRHIRWEAAIAAALAAAAGADVGVGDADFTIGVSVPFRDHLAQPLDTETIGSFQAMLAIPGACRPGQPLWHAAQSFDAGLRNGIRRRHHLAALGTMGLLTPKTPAKNAAIRWRGGEVVSSILDVSGLASRYPVAAQTVSVNSMSTDCARRTHGGAVASDVPQRAPTTVGADRARPTTPTSGSGPFLCRRPIVFSPRIIRAQIRVSAEALGTNVGCGSDESHSKDLDLNHCSAMVLKRHGRPSQPPRASCLSGRVFVDRALPQVCAHTVDAFGARGQETVQPVLQLEIGQHLAHGLGDANLDEVSVEAKAQ